MGPRARADRPRGAPLSGVALRRATAEDLPALVAMLADDPLGAGREDVDGDLAPYRRAFELVDADPAHVLLVAVDGDEVVGTLQLTVLPGLARRGALRGQIEAVRVAAGARGRGIGAAMVGWAVDESRRRGCSLVQLTTDKSRTDARRFYERLGFEASHEGMKLALPDGS
ncbi:GNAT family N-acetyltransferase [Blastococcus sp. SYSU D00922]